MKKLMMLTAMLALVLAIAVPAIAQVSQGLASRSDTGDVSLTFTANSTGSNGSQCVAPLQFGNTAPQQNTQGVLQYAGSQGGFNNNGLRQYRNPFNGFNGGNGSIELTGGTFGFTPELTANCEQTVQQSSAASSQYPG